jgi:hypothetical protein
MGINSNPDLYARIMNDSQFMITVNKLFSAIGECVLRVRKGQKGAVEERDKLLLKLLAHCDWNVGILFPLFYPRMIEGKPLNVMNRPFGFMMTRLQVGGYTAIRGSRQIAKSTNLIGRQMVKSLILPRFQSLYICPHPHHKKTYADRFRQMEAECPFIKGMFGSGSPLRNNLYFKEYPLKGQTNIVNCLQDSSQARSKTADELLYDEYQLLDIQLEGDIEPCQSTSKIPMTVYAGTSTTVDSPLEYRYQEGSQHTWKVKSPNGKDWIDFGDVEVIEKIMHPDGPKCPYSNRILDVRQGEYTPTYRERMEYGFNSIHVPQMIIHDKVRDAIEWEKIYKVFADKSVPRSKFMEEFAGIPSELGAREITEAQLKAICNLGSRDDVFRKVKEGYYRLIVSGFDWGGSDGIPHTKTRTSYTVHTILGLTSSGHVHILFMRQHHGMNFEETTALMLADHKRYTGQAVAADAAGGQVYLNNFSRHIPDNNIFKFNYHAHIFQLLGVPSHGMRNHFTLNKHESLSQLFRDIKEKRILCYNWEEAGPRLSEILNIQRIFVDPQAGPTKIHYHMTPGRPDDTVQAINYGYVLMRLLNGENIVDDADILAQIQASIYHSSATVSSQFGPMHNLFAGDIVSG